MWLIETIQLVLLLAILYKTWQKDIQKFIEPKPKKINDFVCRFCGSDKEVTKTVDGYLACKKCMILVFHKVS